MKSLLRFMLTVTAALLLAQAAFAQGKLRGVVTDANGEPIPGVTVMIHTMARTVAPSR